MREILFRGKNVDNGEWVCGLLYGKDCYGCIAIINSETGAVVRSNTVGQYTGLTDKNDKKMFEGDIVTGLFLHGMSINAVVAFKNGSFGLEWNRGGVNTFNAFTSLCNVEYEVIGNIHDNPELLN